MGRVGSWSKLVYRNKNYLNDGYKNPSEVLDKLWNKIYYHRDANDLISNDENMART